MHAVHEDAPFTPVVRDGVEARLAELAGWLGVVAVPAPH